MCSSLISTHAFTFVTGGFVKLQSSKLKSVASNLHVIRTTASLNVETIVLKESQNCSDWSFDCILNSTPTDFYVTFFFAV